MSKYSSVALICVLLVAIVQAVPEGRIVEGLTAIPGQFPYQVSVKLYGVHNCGGSIISKNYILTAAHCVVYERYNIYIRRAISSLAVQAGTTNRENGGIRIPVAEAIVHPGYFYGGNSDDIALLRLAQPLEFSKYIQPIELSTVDVPDKTSVVVSGWGSLWHHGAKPNQLQWTILKNLSEQWCSFASDKVLCLDHRAYNGVCHGDSGGPAVVDERLVGVASFIWGECGSNNPDGYVKVSSHLDWIKNHSDLNRVYQLALKTQSFLI